MNGAKLALLLIVALAVPASGITMDVDAATSDGWGCHNPDVARMGFSWSVVITGATSQWFGEVIDWGGFAYDDCNLAILGLIASRSGSFQILTPTTGVQGSINLTLLCPAQGRTLAIAVNRGHGPGVLAREATSFCPQPCAPILCHPDTCDYGF